MLLKPDIPVTDAWICTRGQWYSLACAFMTLFDKAAHWIWPGPCIQAAYYAIARVRKFH